MCEENARILRRSRLIGAGCLLQAAGMICLVVGLLSILSIILPLILWPLGVFLIIFGAMKYSWNECSDCGTKLSRSDLKICPACLRKFH